MVAPFPLGGSGALPLSDPYPRAMRLLLVEQSAACFRSQYDLIRSQAKPFNVLLKWTERVGRFGEDQGLRADRR